jgi:hypothetical protein
MMKSQIDELHHPARQGFRPYGGERLRQWEAVQILKTDSGNLSQYGCVARANPVLLRTRLLDRFRLLLRMSTDSRNERAATNAPPRRRGRRNVLAAQRRDRPTGRASAAKGRRTTGPPERVDRRIEGPSH